MKKFIRNQRGQGMIEYVIISSLVGICCLVAVRQFGEVIQKRIENMKAQLTENIQLRDLKR
jgi:Flp pilus assembly pilin Flp